MEEIVILELLVYLNLFLGLEIFLFCLSYFNICLVGLWHDACDSILTHLVNLVLE
jgi:hypothetical protein